MPLVRLSELQHGERILKRVHKRRHAFIVAWGLPLGLELAVGVLLRGNHASSEIASTVDMRGESSGDTAGPFLFIWTVYASGKLHTSPS